ncbi:hypothetical protein CMI37_03330 [Candidatus Pacearchaeota archaeon]|nr:hypothetical protein [Candidatus Pacearchaeota archaeon]
MATEILVNDGGAPARILPYEGYATLTAGEYVKMNASGKLVQNTTSGTKGLGFLLTSLTSGNIGSVISGRGVQLNVYVSGTIASGGPLYVRAAADDGLIAQGAAAGSTVAVALEANTGGPNLKKVQVV